MEDPILPKFVFGQPWLSKAIILTIMAMPLVLAYLAFAFAPLSITCSSTGCIAPPVQLFAGSRAFRMPVEYQMLLFIGLIGGLGGYATALKESRELARNGPAAWLRANLRSTAMGAVTAIGFYVVIRAGTFSPVADLDAVNVLGIAVLAMAAGYSGPAISVRLGAAADQLFEDPGSVKEMAEAIGRLDSRIESTFAKPVLDNWSGEVAVVVFASTDRQIIPGNAQASLLQPGEPIRCQVYFLPRGRDTFERPRHAFMDRIEIRSGNPDPPSVAFDVAIDGADFNFAVERATWRSGEGDEAPLVFDGFAPSTGGHQKLYVTVLQRGRLVQSIGIPVRLRSARTRRRRSET